MQRILKRCGLYTKATIANLSANFSRPHQSLRVELVKSPRVLDKVEPVHEDLGPHDEKLVAARKGQRWQERDACGNLMIRPVSREFEHSLFYNEAKKRWLFMSVKQESGFKDIETLEDACLERVTERACRSGIRCIEEDTIKVSTTTTRMKD